jgi:hypothetical protein
MAIVTVRVINVNRYYVAQEARGMSLAGNLEVTNCDIKSATR